MTHRFHAEAEEELAAAIRYYLEIDSKLAAGFIEEIEYAVAAISRNPLTWRIVEGDIRRYLVHRFPYAVYYSCEADSIIFWAVMHLSRKPSYWKSRIP